MPIKVAWDADVAGEAQLKVSKEGGWATIGGKGGQRYLQVGAKLAETQVSPTWHGPWTVPVFSPKCEMAGSGIVLVHSLCFHVVHKWAQLEAGCSVFFFCVETLSVA